MSNGLAGRRILITGAANGIGRATSERFISEGAQVAALDRDLVALQSLQTLAGIESLAIEQVELTDEKAIAASVTIAAFKLGGLDGIVNCAGIDLVASIDEITSADWDRVIAINLTAPVLIMRAAYPHLRSAGRGTIVNVSSGAGLSPLLHRTAYCASKAGLQMASKALALEVAPFNIRVNCVCPGAVDTALFRQGVDAAPDAAAVLEAVKARYALRRIAEPHEIAAAILWLTSDESSYVTGTAMAVDGGRTFH